MQISDLKELLLGGSVCVEFRDGVGDCEAYAESGMRARLLSVRMLPDDVAVLSVDYAEFDDHNRGVESSNYFDREGNAVLTAREAGQYQSEEALYVMASAEASSILEVLEQDALALYREFREAGSDGHYVRWLERQLLQARATGA